jgi:hypothetical protein
MKVFFILGQTFFDQSMIMARNIEDLYPGSEFSAIVFARSNLVRALDKMSSPRFKRYDWLSGLEERWLQAPLDRDKLKKYEELFGTETLRRILIGDRELGYGYVSCGLVEKTDLIMRTMHNEEAKWSYIVGLLDYLFDIFEKDRPDIVFTYCVATGVAVALGIVSRHFDVLFVQPVFTRIKHCHIIDDNQTSDFTAVKRTYDAAIKSPDVVSGFVAEAEEFLEEFRGKPEKPQDTLTWSVLILRKTSIIGIAKTVAIDIARWGAILLGLKGTRGVLRQRKGHEILLFNLKNHLALRKLSRKTHRCFSYDMPTGEYIYYPLHVDPEASTIVLSPFHTDQMAIIEAISKNMPAGMKLIVKEHLPCAGKRPNGFYKRISTIPGVTLVSPFMDNFSLIKNAAVVATITGTAGLEAMILGKPTLVFGPVHYQIMREGFVYQPEINTGLGKAIEEAMKLKPLPEKNLITYLAALMQESVELSPDDMWFESMADLTKREQAINRMVEKILSMYEEKRKSK